MFKDLFFRVKKIINDYFNLFIILVIVFAVSLFLGIFLVGSKEIKEGFEIIVINYYNSIILVDFNFLGFLFKNIFSLFLSFIILGLLLSNKYTFYISFIIIIYYGYLFGVFLNIFIFKTGITGIITFIFTILIKYAFFIFSIILFTLFSKKLIDTNCNKLNNVFLVGLYAFIFSLIGAVIELLTIITLLRPINLYF